ncbi:MAG: hypothetical protein AUJ49_08460 [Desulfovibrionaceae bacterium CG1_02_65_16]|nr:MAG: hypothetical protein AUJ49_08460 [Desulfovibrionaceae bacterium CG1_02_65_16]
MAVHTKGTKIMRGTGTGSPETFQQVMTIKSVTGPNPTRSEVDVTTLASTAKEFLLGLSDNGEMSFPGLFEGDDLVQQAIIGDLGADTPRNWRVEIPDGTKVAFSAYVKSFPLDLAADAAAGFTLGLRLTGAITWTFPS